MPPRESLRSIAIVLFEGFDELDAIGPFEVFENAAAFGCDLSVELVTLEPTERVTASHGLRVEPDGTLADVDPDLLVVPGGGWNDGSDAGARAEATRGDLPAAIADHHDAGGTVATVCTGGMIASAAGLTEGRPAVTHQGALADLAEAGAEVVEARVVDDGDLLTAAGVTSGLDLALWLVEEICGSGVADTVAAEMAIDRSDDVWRSGGR